MFKSTLEQVVSNLLQRSGDATQAAARELGRQFTLSGGGDTTPEYWFVPQTSPLPVMIGFGSGFAVE